MHKTLAQVARQYLATVALALLALAGWSRDLLVSEPAPLWRASYRLKLTDRSIDATMWQAQLGVRRQAPKVEFGQHCQLSMVLREAD